MIIRKGNRLIRFEDSVENYSVPEDISQLADLAFADCSKLVTLNIHDGVSLIGNYAFTNCTQLNCEIKLPLWILEIGKYAFMN